MTTPSQFGLPSKFETFRVYPSGSTQWNTVEQIVLSTSRFIKLRAGTGTGKSLIYTLAAILEERRALILTPTKGLQDQLYGDFSSIGLTDLKGMSNYPCKALQPYGEFYTGTLGNCNIGPCLFGSDCTVKNQCDYFGIGGALEKVKNAKLVQMNYHKWMSSANWSMFNPFDILICDEVHQAMGILHGFCTVILNADWLKNELHMGLPPEGDNVDWCKTSISKTKILLDTNNDYQEKLKLSKFIASINRLQTEGVKWIRKSTKEGITLSPVWVNKFAERLLYRGIPKIVLVSATVDDKTLRYIGVRKCDEVIVEPIFPSERHPVIHFAKSGPMSPVSVKRKEDMGEGNITKWVDQMDKVIDTRLMVKIAILTVSYDWQKEIIQRSRYSQFMIYHNRDTTKNALKEFRTVSAPSILVSPVVGEGTDFIYDQARCLFIAKMPFFWIGDPLVAARLKDDPMYHDFVVGRTLIQNFGRDMRASDDYGEVFIFDGNWQWFKKRVNWIEEVSELFKECRDIEDYKGPVP